MTRIYNTTTGDIHDESNGMIDAVLAFVAKLKNVPCFNLITKGQIIIGYKDVPIQITNDINLTIDQLEFSKSSGAPEMIAMTLSSNTVTASDLSQFVKRVYSQHIQELNNSLGDTIYFFDQKSRDSNINPPLGHSAAEYKAYKRMLIQSSPKELTFLMTPFYSNKTFENIYGQQVREIENRVNFFLDNKSWYDKKGIPYQLGLLLSGISGARKTSVIRAIANKTKRHIVNVNFANITTATQLKNMFFSDRIQVLNESYYIPINQRLYILEEIDALGDIVKQRRSNKNQSDHINDELSLGEILAVLDGTMEVPGRIIIMTTNHPEILDQALIRPGRIDVQAHFGLATKEFITEMFHGYIDRHLSEEYIKKLPDKLLSPAKVGQVLFRHFGMNHSDYEIVSDIIKTANVLNEEEPYDIGSETEEEEPMVELGHGVKIFNSVHEELLKLGYNTMEPDLQCEIKSILEKNSGLVDESILTICSLGLKKQIYR